MGSADSASARTATSSEFVQKNRQVLTPGLARLFAAENKRCVAERLTVGVFATFPLREHDGHDIPLVLADTASRRAINRKPALRWQQ
jgi:hypothetical protein